MARLEQEIEEAAEEVVTTLSVWLRRLRKFVVAFAAFIVIAVLTIWLFLKSPFGEALVADAIIGTLERDGTIAVTIGDVEGDLPGSVTLSDVSIGDTGGTWLTLERLELVWSPWSVLTGRVVVETVSISKVDVARLPVASGTATSSDPPDLDGLAAVLTRLRVRQLTIDQMTAASPVIGQAVSATAGASLLVDDNDRPQIAVRVSQLQSEALSGGALDATATLLSGGIVAVAVNATERDSRLAARGRINVQSNSINIDGDGTVFPDLLGREAAAAFERATVAFSVLGTAPAPQANLNFAVTAPAVGGTALERIDGSVEAAWTDGRLTFDAAGGIGGLLRLVPDLAPLLQPDVLYAVSGTLDPARDAEPDLSLTSLELDSGAIAVRGSASASLSDQTGRGDLRVTVAGLARLLGRDDLESQTDIDISIDQASAAGARGRLSGSTTALARPGETLFGVLGEAVSLAAEFDATPRVIRLADVEAAGLNVVLAGEAALDLDASKVTATASGSVNDLASLSETLSGAAAFTASIDGPLSGPNVSAAISSDTVSVRQETFTSIDLTVAADLSAQPLTTAAAGTFSIAEGPVTIDIVVTRDEGRLRLDPLALQGAGVALNGVVSLDQVSGLAEGAAAFSLQSLAIPSALTGLPLAGTSDGRITLGADETIQTASWDVTLSDVRFGGAQVGLESLSLIGSAKVSEVPEIDVSVTGESGFIGNQPIADLSVEVSGPISDLSFNATTTSPTEELAVVVGGRAALTDDSTLVTLDSLTLADTWGTLDLVDPATVRLAGGSVVLQPATVTVAGGRLTAAVDLDRANGTVVASLSGESLPFRMLETYDPDLPVTGHFSFTSSLSGPLTAPEARFEFRTDTIALPDTGLEGVGANLILSHRGDRLSVDGRFTGLSDAPATVTGSLPVRLNLVDNEARIPLDGPASLGLTWSGAIEPVWSLLPLISHRLNGQGDIALSLTGTLADPVVDGYARLDGGSYENLDLGTLLRDLRLELTADSASSVRLDVSGTDGEDGYLSGSGVLNRDAAGDFAGDLTLTIAGAKLVRRDDLAIKGSGQLTYGLTPERDSLTGAIEVDSAAISLNASYADAVPTLDVVDPSAPEPPAGRQRAGKDVDLAIAVTAPSKLDIAGRGLDSEWSADMQIGGTLANPEITGSLDMLRGEFAFLGELFPLTRGRIGFTGGGRIDPELDVVASRTAQGFTAQVLVGGRATAPSITLSSDPPLPQDEVLARLLFGKSAGQLGPLEGVQLANAASEFSGLAGRGGVVGSLRRSVGLDVFRFGSNANGNTIVVGERLSDNVFVGVEQGLEGQGSEIIIEWQLTNTLSLSSALNQETGSDIGLQWSRDY